MKTKVPYGMKDYTIHGTELEPFHIYHQIYEHGGLQVPFHWHKEMEWIWVEKGSLELTLGTQRKILQKQDFVMINSYELHQLRSIGNTSSIHHALVFLPDMLAFSYPDHCQISYIEPLLSRQLLLPSFLPKNLSCISSVRSIFQELLVLYDTRPSGWQLLLKNNLYHILVILFSEISVAAFTRKPFLTDTRKSIQADSPLYSGTLRQKNLSGGPGFFPGYESTVLLPFFQEAVSDDPDDLY